MSANPNEVARAYVHNIELPGTPREAARGASAVPYELGAAQAVVVGADVVSFVPMVTQEQRADVVNALLLAQFAAKQHMQVPASLAELAIWYAQYFDVLAHLGFAIQSQEFRQYQQRGDGFEAHEAILAVAAPLLAGAPAALAVLTATVSALKQASSNEPWFTIFNRESHSSTAARFQVATIDTDAHGALRVALAAFGLETTGTVTQVLLFKFRSSEVTLQHRAGTASINTAVLAAVRLDLAHKLAAHAGAYLANLPIA